jgi:c(7)-type cytochrome triheme protein
VALKKGSQPEVQTVLRRRLMSRPRLTFWRAVLLLILAAGTYATVIRFTRGLGASTALSDQFPWGLWIGFDVLCGVALAAGGFTISTAVYIFNIERFKPIIRPTILTAFLGYMLVIVALMFDLGKPYNIWHPLVMWNPSSVMFEVAWCVTLYTIVLALEFSPMVFERLGMNKAYRVVRSVTIPLVILGLILSTLHQSSLGSLYLIVPNKLHALWYSPLLPVFFFISAIALGCAMTILESFLSLRAFRKSLELDLLSQLGKVAAVALAVYLVLLVQDLNGRGALRLAFEPTYESRMFVAEVLLGVVAPIVLLVIPAVRGNQLGLFVAALMVVLGFIMNRLNVSITGMDRSSGITYLPSWTELSVTATIVALGFILFGLAVKYLKVFPPGEITEAARGRLPELPAVAVLGRPFNRTTMLTLVLGAVFMFSAIGLSYSGIKLRKPPAEVAGSSEEVNRDTSPSIDLTRLPEEVTLERGAQSPGEVLFRHASHINAEAPDCRQCHSGQFSMLKASIQSGREQKARCAACHNGENTFDLNDKASCASCHGSGFE